MTRQYDYLLVGAGLTNAVIARRLENEGKRCLVIERRGHIGGNVYTERRAGIDVHMYGPHIFHTDKREIWEFANSVADFRQYVYSPLARFGSEIYCLPFNMHTFHQIFGVSTPHDAREAVERDMDIPAMTGSLEERALSTVGRRIYERLVKGYTEKQWGKPCHRLPGWIIGRLPLRFTYDNNYFTDRYQGIPAEGYTDFIRRLLGGVEVKLDTDFLRDIAHWRSVADKIVYTGAVDELCGYELGPLEYRSLEFVHRELDTPDFQGAAVINETSAQVPYTRVIEHKHFCRPTPETRTTMVTWEYPRQWHPGKERFYPVNDDRNDGKYREYSALCRYKYPEIILAGRLGLYKYLNMDQIIEQALNITL